MKSILEFLKDVYTGLSSVGKIIFAVVIVIALSVVGYFYLQYKASSATTPIGNKTINVQNQGGKDANQNVGNINL